MSDGLRTTNLLLAEGDIVELVVNAQVQGIGPLATRRAPILSLSSQLLAGTSPIALRFTSAEGRLTTLETLANIPNGSTLVADVAAAKSLIRSSSAYRPGDLLASWTANTSVGASATAITVGGNYSVVPGGDGQVLQVAGGSTFGVGPIYADEIAGGEVYEYTTGLRRMVDGASAVVLVRLACFTGDDTYLGVLTILTLNRVVADGFRRATIRVAAGTILAAFPTATRAKPYVSGAANTGTLQVSMIRRRLVDSALPDQDYNHDNVVGFSSTAGSMGVYHLLFVHGQSLALGQNLNDADPLVAAIAKYPGFALTMEPTSVPNRGPRLSTTAPDKIVDLVEVAATNARETICSGLVNHALQRFDLETAPKITVTIAGGYVTGATITKPGLGFFVIPPITLNNTGTGGTGAVLTANVSAIEDGGRFIGVTVSNAGDGNYTTAPTAVVGDNSSGIVLPKMLIGASGKVGARYIQLRQGETRWDWIDAFIRAAKAGVAPLGGTVINFMSWWKQGEADLITGTPRQPEDHYSWMAQYARQRADATKAITGQTLDPILTIDPAATCHPDYDQWSQSYPRGLALIRRHPLIRISGGSYHYPHSDPSHLTTLGYNRCGQQNGRVYTHEVWQAGWVDIHPTRAWRTGATTFKAEFAVPPPDTPLLPRLGLVIDLSGAEIQLSGIQGYGGFACRSLRDGRVLPITNITVGADGRTLTFTHGVSTAVVAAADVVPTSNLFNVFGTIGWETGTRVRISTTGTLPTGLVAGTDYWVVRTAPTTLKLAASYDDAIAGTVVTISNAGTGTHTLTSDATLTGDGPIQLVYATRRNPGDTNTDGPVKGARGCLRNNRAQPNMYDGYLSHDWATPFDIVVA